MRSCRHFSLAGALLLDRRLSTRNLIQKRKLSLGKVLPTPLCSGYRSGFETQVCEPRAIQSIGRISDVELLKAHQLISKTVYRGGPLWCTSFRRVFRSRKWAREIGQKPGEDVVWQRNAGRRQPPPQAHFISPNPPSFRWSHPTESATRRLRRLFSASPHPP